MSRTFYLPLVKPVAGIGGDSYTHMMVDVKYQPGQGVLVFSMIVKPKDDGSFVWSPMTTKSGRFLFAEFSRKSKKVDAAIEQAIGQIKTKTGPVWADLVKTAEANKTEIGHEITVPIGTKVKDTKTGEGYILIEQVTTKTAAMRDNFSRYLFMRGEYEYEVSADNIK